MKKTVKGLLVLALTVLANVSFAKDIYFDVNIIGEDKFKALYPEIDWAFQLDYAESLGMGSGRYELVKI